MRKAFLTVFYVLAVIQLIFAAPGPENFKNDPDPGHFIPWISNAGQFSDEVAFLKRTSVADIWVLKDRTIVYDFTVPDGKNIRIEERILTDLSALTSPTGKNEDGLKIKYLGAGYGAHPEGIDASAFQRLCFGNIAPGIKLQLDARYGNAEKLLIFEPGTDADQMLFELNGMEKMELDQAGQLVLEVNGQKISFSRPVAWQIDDEGNKLPVEVAYHTENEDGKYSYGFDPVDYDLSRTLYIDPLISSGYFGGNQKDVVQQISAGKNKQVYVAGVTESPNLFSIGTYDNTYNGNMDIFAAVFNSDLSSMQRVTYIGGSAKDTLGAMVLDENNRIYLLGTTASSDFPVTTNAYSNVYIDAQINVSDMFIACLNDRIDTLVSSTYLGSDREDIGLVLDLNVDGQLFIAGMSAGKMPEVGPQWQTYTTGLVFAKMDPNLENLLFTNSIGDFGESRPTDIAVDSSGHFFITGFTSDAQFPVTPGSFSEDLSGKNDVFVARIKDDLSQIIAASYIGGNEDDYAYALLLDSLDHVYLAGETRSGNFPVTPNAVDQSFTFETVLRSDAFICMMDSLLRLMVNGSFFGGLGNQAITDLSMDSLFNVIFGGYTSSGRIPTFCYSHDDTYNGGDDGIIGRFSEKLAALDQSTFFGGSLNDRVLCLTLGEKDFIYVGGRTNSSDFPFKNGYDGSFNGGERDGFLSMFSTLEKPEPCCSEPIFPDVLAVEQPTELTLRWTKAINAAGYILSVGTSEGVFDLIDHVDTGVDTFYHLTDLPCGETIFVYVHPYNEFLTNIYCPYYTFSTIEPNTEEQNIDICAGESYFWKGQYYDQPGHYALEEDNGGPCPDIFSLNLSVHEIFEFTTTYEMCQGDTLFWEGDFYTESVYIKKKFETAFGCDSTYVLDLWVFPAQSVHDTLALCTGDQITWNGQIFTEPGDYFSISTDQHGCDVFHYLNLFADGFTDHQVIELCQGDQFEWQGNLLVQSGTYTVSYPSVNGCDSVYILDLFFYPYINEFDTLSICPGDFIEWHGQIWDTAGDYLITETNDAGCESNYHLHLTTELLEYHYYSSICEGDELIWQGQSYTESGQFVFIADGGNACDTTYFLHLSVIPDAVVNDTLQICYLDIFCWHGIPVYEEGDYSFFSEHEGSCDTLYQLNVSFYTEYMHFEEIFLCEGDTLQWHGMEITGAGEYEWVDHSFEFCDTVYNALVEMVDINTELTVAGDTIFAVLDPEATYQWVNCADFGPVTGENNHYYVPDTCDSLFAVVIEKDGCSEISACICLEGTGLDRLQATQFKVFPNPSYGKMRLVLDDQHPENYRLYVKDITGRMVQETELDGQESQLDLSLLPAGTYVLIAVNKQSVFQAKVLITR